MKKGLTLILFLSALYQISAAQAAKPTIMVVPSDNWCERNGFVSQIENMGTSVSSPDYQKALKENAEIRILISAMGDFMAKNNYPIQSLESELHRIQNEDAEMAIMMGKRSGSEIEETPIERLRRTAKADIIIDLDYSISRIGPRKQIEFNLQAIDAYSSKIISGNTGVGTLADVPITTLLEEAVLSFKDNFLDGLQRYFDDLFENGREVSVTLFRYANCPVDFEEEYDYNGKDAELSEVIEAWFADNSVNGRFTLNSKSANRMRFNQVRIPLYGQNINGKKVAIQAEGFVKPLVNFLKKEPYNLVVGVTPKGLGEVWITIGDK